jgi:hypothetical protein
MVTRFLENLAWNFPDQMEQWLQVKDPSKGIHREQLASLKSLYARVYPASDLSKVRTAKRSGLFVREWEAGDGPHTLHIPSLIKENKWRTKLEIQEGRQKIALIWLVDRSLEFPNSPELTKRGEPPRPNKGQLSLALLACLQLMHKFSGHQVHLLRVTGNLVSSNVSIPSWQPEHFPGLKNLFSYQRIYLISDFLFDWTDPLGGAKALLPFLPRQLHPKMHVLIVRDLLESLRPDNPLFLEWVRMENPRLAEVSSFLGNSSWRESGQGYEVGLREQELRLREFFSNAVGFDWINGDSSFGELMKKVKILNHIVQ